MPDPVAAHVRLTRLIRAPREQVFEAWLDPEIRKQWWCATPEMHCPLAEIDPTPGGRYRLAMRKDENESVAFGEFVEIDRPERLVFTWSWEHDLDFGGGSRVTVTLHDTTFDGQPATELVLLHEQLKTAHERSEHTVGWLGVLQALGTTLAPAGTPEGAPGCAASSPSSTP